MQNLNDAWDAVALVANPNRQYLEQSGNIGFHKGKACGAVLPGIDERARFVAPGIKESDQ